MATSKIFLSCIVILMLFNVVFYLITTNGELVPTKDMISEFIGIGIIAVVASIIPFTGGATTVKWFLSTLVVLGIVFRQEIQVTIAGEVYSFSVGVGLGSNMTNLFKDTSGIGLLPFLFFTFISLIATITGIMMTMGGDD